MFRYTVALCLSLLFCSLTSLAYRPLGTYGNQFLQWSWGLDYLHCRAWIQGICPLPAWAVYNAPSGVWVFGLCLLGWRLPLGWDPMKIPLFYLAPLFGLVFEGIQYWGWSDGTADVKDVLAVLLGFAAASFYCHFLLAHGWRNPPGFWRYFGFLAFFLAAFVTDLWVVRG